MNDHKSDDQSPCCGGSDCCQTGESSQGKRKTRLKTFVFTAVLLLAGVVTIYSLFGRYPSAASALCCPPGSGACAAACVVVAPLPGLVDQSVEADITLAVFLPAGCEFPQYAAEAIHEVITDLEARRTRVQMQYVTPADSEYAKMADRYMITSCPTILVSTLSGTVVLSQKGISKDSILSIYEQSQKSITSNVTSETDQAR